MVVSQYSQPWEDICPLFIGSCTYTSSVYAGEASHSVAVAPQSTPLTLDGALTGHWWHWQWRGKQPQSHYGWPEAKLGEQFSRRSSSFIVFDVLPFQLFPFHQLWSVSLFSTSRGLTCHVVSLPPSHTRGNVSFNNECLRVVLFVHSERVVLQ